LDAILKTICREMSHLLRDCSSVQKRVTILHLMPNTQQHVAQLPCHQHRVMHKCSLLPRFC